MAMRIASPGLVALHLLGLCAFALAQPLLDVVARHPEVLVAHRVGPSELMAAVLLVLVVPAAVLFSVVQLAARASPQLGRGLLLAAVALLVALATLPPAKRAGLPDSVLLVLVCSSGLLAATAYARLRPVRAFATVLACAPLIFAIAFFANPSVTRLLSAPDDIPVEAVSVAANTPVVMVVFDELPTSSLLDEDERVDPVRYPAFARLAGEATWFRNASAVHFHTQYAVPAMLTGRYPRPGELPIARDHPQNLFALLGGAYRLNVVETLTSLYAGGAEGEGSRLARFGAFLSDLWLVGLHVLLPDAWTLSLAPIDETWRDFGYPIADPARKDVREILSKRAQRFRRFVASIDGTGEPALHFLHIPLPHAPWSLLPSGRSYYPPRSYGTVDYAWGEHPWWAIQGYQQHLLQLGFTDALLGELLDHLDRVGLYDRSLVVVAADHGVGFWPNESKRDPTEMKYPEDVLGVPLFVKLPGQREGVESRRNVETVDILPTLADALDVRLPWPVDGCSALDAHCPERAEKRMYGHGAKSFQSLDPRLPLRRASLDRKLSLFGSRSKEGLHPAGPRPALLGRRVDEIGIAEPPGAPARLMRETFDYARRAPRAFTLVRITGTLSSPPENGDPPLVALSIDGTVRAVVPALPALRSPLVFSALLPESVAPARAEQIGVWSVTGPPDAPRLRRHEMRLESLPLTGRDLTPVRP